jgi:hypothetical protein
MERRSSSDSESAGSLDRHERKRKQPEGITSTNYGLEQTRKRHRFITGTIDFQLGIDLESINKEIDRRHGVGEQQHSGPCEDVSSHSRHKASSSRQPREWQEQKKVDEPPIINLSSDNYKQIPEGGTARAGVESGTGQPHGIRLFGVDLLVNQDHQQQQEVGSSRPDVASGKRPLLEDSILPRDQADSMREYTIDDFAEEALGVWRNIKGDLAGAIPLDKDKLRYTVLNVFTNFKYTKIMSRLRNNGVEQEIMDYAMDRVYRYNRVAHMIRQTPLYKKDGAEALAKLVLQFYEKGGREVLEKELTGLYQPSRKGRKRG